MEYLFAKILALLSLLACFAALAGATYTQNSSFIYSSSDDSTIAINVIFNENEKDGPVGIGLTAIKIDHKSKVQQGPATTKSKKISVSLPISYLKSSEEGKMNLPVKNKDIVAGSLALQLPVFYLNNGVYDIILENDLLGLSGISNVRMNESGTLKHVSNNNITLRWKANLSVENMALIIDLPPPYLLEVEDPWVNNTHYEKKFGVMSDNKFSDVLVSFNVDKRYDQWTLYTEGRERIDLTNKLNLKFKEGNITFGGLNTSQKPEYFKLEGRRCVENWVCSEWSEPGVGCGTRTCFDLSRCNTKKDRPDLRILCISGETREDHAVDESGKLWRTLINSQRQPDYGVLAVGKSFEVRALDTSDVWQVIPNEYIIEVNIVGNNSVSIPLELYNNVDEPISFFIDLENIKEFAKSPAGLTRYSVEIGPESTKSVELMLFTNNLDSYGFRRGKVGLDGAGIHKSIQIVLEYSPEIPEIDVELNWSSEYDEIFPNQAIVVNLAITELNGLGTIQTELSYYLIDENGQKVYVASYNETMNGQKHVVHQVDMPDLALGTYVLYVNAQYLGIKGAGSKIFVVKEKSNEKIILSLTDPFSLLLLFMVGVFGWITAVSVLDLIKKQKSNEKPGQDKKVFK